jgi:HAMP domain-containing protein
MDEVLAFRKRVFLTLGTLGFFLILAADSLADLFGNESDPDLLTAAFLVVAVIDLLVASRLLLGQERLARARTNLARRGRDGSLLGVGKVASVIAASLAMTPLLMGFVLLVLSGDAWRLYLFAGVSLLAGFYLWRRIEEGIRQLSGF